MKLLTHVLLTVEPSGITNADKPSQLPPPSVTLLASDSSSPFKGFLLEARDAAAPNSTVALGSFSLLQPGVSQLLGCGGRQVRWGGRGGYGSRPRGRGGQ